MKSLSSFEIANKGVFGFMGACVVYDFLWVCLVEGIPCDYGNDKLEFIRKI